MTVFDKMCGFAERFNPTMEQVLRRAALFKYDDVTATPLVDNPEDFFLPFSVTAVKDNVGCVVLVDPYDAAKGGATRRGFYFFAPGPPNEKEFLIAEGHVEFRPKEVAGRVVRVFNSSGKKLRCDDAVEEERTYHNMLNNVNSVMCALHCLNTRDRFVVETEPAKPAKQGPKILREHERPTYTLLTVPEIVRTLGLDGAAPTPTGATKAPHARRRHWRTYEDDRYVNVKGQRVLIPSTWVGPKETTLNGRKYRVRIDL